MKPCGGKKPSIKEPDTPGGYWPESKGPFGGDKKPTQGVYYYYV